MARVLLVVVILLALVLALFGVQNPQRVNIRFVGFQTGLVPLYVVILLSTLAGVLLSTILGLRSRVSTSLRIRKQDKQIADLEQKLAARSRSLVPDVPDAPAETTSEPQTTTRV